MNFQGKHRRIALGSSIGLLILTQLAQRNPIGALRIGAFTFPILSYVICPEIYNSLL
ncbi:unnamed protein product [Paramecium primaurelia]|uniref:Uncharacterized protein n=1 Tax=Paramecium primaurelia TaxID=5886 RepID=A0A8S1N493_PARPR|nr:unnamed protein product [Paramecium primaurelia]